MYAVSEIMRFTPGRRQERLERLAWMHGLMQESAGFGDALIAKYLGDATQYLVLRYWRDAAAYAHFRQGFMRDHAANRPVGLYEIEENLPWECYHEHQQGEQPGSFLVKTHRRVPTTTWDAYSPFQQEVETQQIALGGLRQLRRLKSLDTTDVLNVQRYETRENFDRYFESAPHFDLTQKWPEGIELVSTQCYEVVSET